MKFLRAFGRGIERIRHAVVSVAMGLNQAMTVVLLGCAIAAVVIVISKCHGAAP